MGVSRTAVWKQLQILESMGLPLESVKGKGYKIPENFELLDADQIASNLNNQVKGQLNGLHIYQSLDSTNKAADQLIEAQTDTSSGAVILSEYQTMGRGRRGKSWVSPFAANLYLYMVWDFDQGASALQGLSLAIGVAVSRALNQLKVEGVRLKWPNDIYSSHKKVGGILCESKMKKNKIEKIVIGIGLNVNETIEEHPENLHNDISTMFSITNHSHQRELIVAEFVNYFEKLLNIIPENSRIIIDEWQNLCMHMNQSIFFHSEEKASSGVFIGLNKDGYAKIKIDGKTKTFSSINLI